MNYAANSNTMLGRSFPSFGQPTTAWSAAGGGMLPALASSDSSPNTRSTVLTDLASISISIFAVPQLPWPPGTAPQAPAEEDPDPFHEANDFPRRILIPLIPAMIAALGSEDFPTREKATEDLRDLMRLCPISVRNALRYALAHNKDAEIRDRSWYLLEWDCGKYIASLQAFAASFFVPSQAFPGRSDYAHPLSNANVRALQEYLTGFPEFWICEKYFPPGVTGSLKAARAAAQNLLDGSLNEDRLKRALGTLKQNIDGWR